MAEPDDNREAEDAAVPEPDDEADRQLDCIDADDPANS